jgi:hypothetical protein
MSLLFPPTPAWRRTRAAALPSASFVDSDSSTMLSDPAPQAGMRGKPRQSGSSASGTLWQRVTDWLAGDAWNHSSFGADTRLPAARDALARELADIQTLDAHRLVLRIGTAQDRPELWHLRSAFFDLVSRVHSQAEAEARLLRLAPHFPPPGRRGR